MLKKTISICIPTYNRFSNLKETLTNVTKLSLSQYFVKEILIIDNNQNLKGKEVVEKFLLKNKKIRYIKNEQNIGPENNFRKCIEQAKGDYVWLIADDDLLINGSLDIVSEHLKSDFDCLITNWSIYDNNFKYIIKNSIFDKNLKFVNDKNFILKNFSTKISFISSIIFKKNLFSDKNILLYDEFVKYQLSFLIFVYSIIADERNTILFEKNPLIKQRGDNDPYLRDYVKNYYNVFSDGLNFFHKKIIELGYDKHSIKISKINSFNSFIVRDLINRKISKNNFKFSYENSYKNYNDIFILKFFMILIYITPNFLLSFLKIMKSCFKR